MNKGENISLTIGSKLNDHKNIELTFTINSTSNNINTNLTKIGINDLLENDYSIYDLKIIVVNELLKILNAKFDIKTNENNTVYSLMIIEGFKDNELFKIN